MIFVPCRSDMSLLMVMTCFVGEDCSDAFELANHTENAREMMKQHCVGRLIDVSSVT